jgi:hypothetical protein
MICNFLDPRRQHASRQVVDYKVLGIGHCGPFDSNSCHFAALAIPPPQTGNTVRSRLWRILRSERIGEHVVGVEAEVFCSNGLLTTSNKQPNSAHGAILLPQKRCIQTRSSKKCTNNANPTYKHRSFSTTLMQSSS